MREPKSQPVDEYGPESWLFVCRTCARDEPCKAGRPSRGSAFASRLRVLLQDSELVDRLELRVVSCLNGCPKPCNISFRGNGKRSVRFGGLEPGDEPAIIAFAQAYVSSRRGHVLAKEWDERLRAKPVSQVAPADPTTIKKTEPTKEEEESNGREAL